MTWDPAPWVVTGARHSAEVARLQAYVASRGNEGIINPTDLKVLPLGVPGSTVRVSPGAATILNRYAGGSQQSYSARNPTEDTSPVITATGSGGGRSDLIVARIEDPQYPGTATPSNPLTAQYVFTRVIPGVPAATKTAKELNLNYPAIALARLDIPPSTGAITAAMIVDLRKVANPRREKGSRVDYPVGHTMSKTAYADFPYSTGSVIPVDVPEWATQITVRCDISGVLFSGTAGQLQGGGIRSMFDSVADTQFQAVMALAPNRSFVSIVGKHSISAAQRGTTRNLKLQGFQTAGTGTITVDSQSTIALEWEFTEAAA